MNSKFFTTELVSGDCPHCHIKVMLVKIYDNLYRCVSCGEDTEQKVNGVIKYMKVNKDTSMAIREFIDG
tara:strand:+ start:122 stop:328 length:207 start_codon:yes stop_codon:yes gene_type:complete